MLYFIALDFETTGLSPTKGDRIVEIGAVKFDIDGSILDIFSELANPGRLIPYHASQIHGITDKDVAGCDSAEKVWNRFHAWAGNFAALVAHNAIFEQRFICDLYNGKMPKIEFVDTLPLSRSVYCDLPNHKLGTVCSHIGYKIVNAHRALPDARATARLLADIIRRQPAVISHFVSEYETHQRELANRLNETESLLDSDMLDFYKELYDTMQLVCAILSSPDRLGPSGRNKIEAFIQSNKGFSLEFLIFCRGIAQAVRHFPDDITARDHVIEVLRTSQQSFNYDYNDFFDADELDFMLRTAYQEFAFPELYRPIGFIVKEQDNAAADKKEYDYEEDPITLLKWMSKHSEPAYRIVAAGHPKCPQEMLAALSDDPNPEVQCAAIENAAISAAVLERRYRTAIAALDKNANDSSAKEIAIIAIRHDNFPEALIRERLKTYEDDWWEYHEEQTPYNLAIAQNPGCSPRSLAVLFWRSEFGGIVQREITRNRRFDVAICHEVMVELATSENVFYYANWPKCHPDLLDRISKLEDTPERIAEWDDHSLDIFDTDRPDILEILPWQSVMHAVMSVADNAAARPETLIGISNRKSLPAIIIKAAISNPRHPASEAANRETTCERLSELLRYDCEEVKISLASNHNTPASVLLKLVGEESRGVKTAIAKNPGASEDVLIALALKNYAEVLCNPNTTPLVLRSLLTVAPPAVRSCVVQHEKATDEILFAMAADKDEDVRSTVAKLAKCPELDFGHFFDQESPIGSVACRGSKN
jgi:DNA polymerase III subunit epsilon